MDDLDRKILDALQHTFPLQTRPFDILAGQLGIEPDLLWQRVEAMLDQGVIRRLGASFDSRKLGFAGTLAAARVAPEQVDRAAEVIGQYPEVTHSYLRAPAPGSEPPQTAAMLPFNLWFTIIAPDRRRIEAILDEIRTRLSLADSDILNLPMKRLFKLDARFPAQP
jgi:DNA-binding Lrp family transcriptional regulator